MSDNKIISERFSKMMSSVKRRPKKNIPDRTNGDQYYYIHEFEQADEKICISYDKRNEEIYQKNLKLYNNINKKLVNTPFNIDNKPEPPKRPSNYERLHLWKKRNVKISAHHQSLAILYLITNNINIKIDDYSNGVEPFEAVNIAEKIAIDKNENMANVVKSFLHNIHLDNDVFNKYKKNSNVYNIEYPINRLQSNLSVSEPNLNQSEMEDNLSNISRSNSINDINQFVSSNPEHQSVHDKINYYNRNSFYPTIPIDYSRLSAISTAPTAPMGPTAPPPSAPPPPSPSPPPKECHSDSKPPSYRTNSDSSN
tara:strand:+ start:64 stop:996 length:933 start_codon:yes stop_codon:yes gene_type:complete